MKTFGLCLFLVGIGTGFIAPSANALEIRADEVTEKSIEKSLDLVPTCEMKSITSHLQTIRIVPHGKLGSMTINGVVYYRLARSFYYHGSMYLDTKNATNRDILLHEMGHWWWWSPEMRKYDDAIKTNVAHDWAGLTPKQRYDNDYLEDHIEAEAEVYAYLRDPSYHFGKRNPALFKRTVAIENAVMEKSCE